MVSTNKTVSQLGDLIISFGGHQSQTIERIKASYDMYKCILTLIYMGGGAKLPPRQFFAAAQKGWC